MVSESADSKASQSLAGPHIGRSPHGNDEHMASMDDRRDAFENKFAHDEELRFKATARRNRLLGQWAAAELGRPDVEEYAKSVVMADFEEAGDGDVIRKVKGDLDAAGKGVTEAEIRRKLDDLMAKAVADIQAGT